MTIGRKQQAKKDKNSLGRRFLKAKKTGPTQKKNLSEHERDVRKKKKNNKKRTKREEGRDKRDETSRDRFAGTWGVLLGGKKGRRHDMGGANRKKQGMGGAIQRTD